MTPEEKARREALKHFPVSEDTENDPLFPVLEATQKNCRASFIQGYQAALESDEVKGLVEGLKDIFSLMDEGWLGRDTSNDHQIDWAIKTAPYLLRLKKAEFALAEFEKARGGK